MDKSQLHYLTNVVNITIKKTIKTNYLPMLNQQ
jgi:hypothetical protein